MANKDLHTARLAKNDEFYTRYEDIQKEINAYIEYNPDVFRDKTILLPCDDPEWSNFTKFFAQNFERYGIKKLISTSYACNSKGDCETYCPTEFEKYSPKYDKNKTQTHGKIFTLTHDINQNGVINIEDLEWTYLDGDGDFRSDEIKKLRDEADIIITNPPFSLFREFVAWIFEAKKSFLIMGNKNAITFKDIFPLIKSNKMWMGVSIHSGGVDLRVPSWWNMTSAHVKYDDEGNRYINLPYIRWFTNIDHGRRHQPLQLMTMADNIKHSKHPEVRGQEYRTYDNYDAIEVPYTDAIPSDYDGVMGVPITFLDKYCPEQFDIVSSNDFRKREDVPYKEHGLIKDKEGAINGKPTYARILIRKKKGGVQ